MCDEHEIEEPGLMMERPTEPMPPHPPTNNVGVSIEEATIHEGEDELLKVENLKARLEADQHTRLAHEHDVDRASCDPLPLSPETRPWKHR